MEDRLTTLFQWMRRQMDAQARFSARASRTYATEAVAEQEGEHGPSMLELALPALYGRYGVLPDYFTDELLHQDERDSAIRTFLDIFNRRLFRAMFGAWQAHELFLEDALAGENERGREESFLLRRIAGQLAGENLPEHIQGLRWNQMGLYRARVRTSAGLLTMVRAFFPDLEVALETFVPVTREIPPDQRPVLGRQPIRIGAEGNLLTGLTIRDRCGGVRLRFKALGYDEFMRLLPGGTWRPLLEELVGDYTRGTPNCLVALELRAEEIPPWQMGARRIGCDMWLQSRPMDAPYTVDAGRF